MSMFRVTFFDPLRPDAADAVFFTVHVEDEGEGVVIDLARRPVAVIIRGADHDPRDVIYAVPDRGFDEPEWNRGDIGLYRQMRIDVIR
jgi:hypothetical protein